MKRPLPSPEFDEAVSAIASDKLLRALNGLLLLLHLAVGGDYILRVELHSRLASDPDPFVSGGFEPAKGNLPRCTTVPPPDDLQFPLTRCGWDRKLRRAVALAACAALLAMGIWGWRVGRPDERQRSTTKAVAVLSRVVNAQ